MNNIGLYLHIPFCDRKCPYCDFYSLPADETLMEQYTNVLCTQLAFWCQTISAPADTLYLGGGTPSLLGGKRLGRLIQTARELYLLDGAEITVEVNPCTEGLGDTVSALAGAGVNRLSVGMQSIHDRELQALGRRHRTEQVIATVQAARQAGIENISLDLMVGIPHQTMDSLKQSIGFCACMAVTHVSAYLLKIEPGTSFYRKKEVLSLPNESTERALYLSACERLEAHGFLQYEISNFARPGLESAHNLHYWKAEPYLGLGPAAHSFLNDRRFYYPRNLSDFLTQPETVDDGPGGGIEEYSMLRLRLTEGLLEKDFFSRFGQAVPMEYRTRLGEPALQSLCRVDENGIRFTREGFLVSNLLTGRMLGY